MKIAVLGAPGTGKTSLVTALRLLAMLSDANPAQACTISEPATLERADRHDLILLMGLDLPPRAHINSNSTSATAHMDAQLRQLLHHTAAPYTVVYGSGQARTDCALQAIEYHRKHTSARPASKATTWHWACENCSDAACERSLFSALVKQAGDSVRQ